MAKKNRDEDLSWWSELVDRFLEEGRTVFDYAMVSTMERAAAVGVSPNRITLLRDADGDGLVNERK